MELFAEQMVFFAKDSAEEGLEHFVEDFEAAA